MIEDQSPRVIMFHPDGRQEEILMTDISMYHSVDDVPRVQITGYVKQFPARPAGTELRGLQGKNAGGIPPTVVMTCPHCNHHDEGHECDAWPEDDAGTPIYFAPAP